PHAIVHVGDKGFDCALRNVTGGGIAGFKWFEREKKMECDQLKAPARGVRDTAVAIKGRLTRRGHDTAINFLCCTRGFGAPPVPVQHRLRWSSNCAPGSK